MKPFYFKEYCKWENLSIFSSIFNLGICLTTDIDTLITHMNNARYIRELDFARVDFYERTGLYKTILSKGGGIVQGAATIRYRRFIKPFSRYEITSKILYWDQQTIFFEHQFIGKSDGFIHAIILCRQRVINCSAEDIMATLLAEDATDSGFEKLEVGDLNKVKPEMPLEVIFKIKLNQ